MCVRGCVCVYIYIHIYTHAHTYGRWGQGTLVALVGARGPLEALVRFRPGDPLWHWHLVQGAVAHVEGFWVDVAVASLAFLVAFALGSAGFAALLPPGLGLHLGQQPALELATDGLGRYFSSAQVDGGRDCVDYQYFLVFGGCEPILGNESTKLCFGVAAARGAPHVPRLFLLPLLRGRHCWGLGLRPQTA